MKYFNNINYNSKVILTYFFISLLILILNKLTNNKLNKLLATSRGSIFNPLTYTKLVTHIFAHSTYSHFRNNFLYILLVGPIIEEKYGSINLIKMLLLTSIITAIVNIIFSKRAVLGSSSIVYMLIMLSSLVNLKIGTIPLTLILIFIFYIIGELRDSTKKDNISHLSHLIGALCGFIYGFYIF